MNINVGDQLSKTFRSNYINPDGTAAIHEFDVLVRITAIENGAHAKWETVTVTGERGRPTQIQGRNPPNRGGFYIPMMNRAGYRLADNRNMNTDK